MIKIRFELHRLSVVVAQLLFELAVVEAVALFELEVVAAAFVDRKRKNGSFIEKKSKYHKRINQNI